MAGLSGAAAAMQQSATRQARAKGTGDLAAGIMPFDMHVNCAIWLFALSQTAPATLLRVRVLGMNMQTPAARRRSPFDMDVRDRISVSEGDPSMAARRMVEPLFCEERARSSGEATASWSFRHCKPAACILGLTGVDMRLSLI